jgi:tungstate transport system substrate-binding protein
MTRRRTVLGLGAGALALAFPDLLLAAQARSLTDPLRVAADEALVDSGLARALQTSFGRDTGVAVRLLRAPATIVLEGLERGEHDASLTNAPEEELALQQRGLAHGRQRVARTDFVLVGPAMLAKPLAAGQDIGLALARLAQAQVLFLSQPNGSGTHLAELNAWRAAKTAPSGEWYVRADLQKPLLAQARERRACALVERGVWAAQRPGKGGAKDFVILCEGDARMAIDVHVMRTFRAERQHPAGKLFVSWITGRRGQAIVAEHRGYR